MLEQKETLEIEKFSSYFNLLLAGLLILYFLMFNFFGKTKLQPNDIVFAISITILGIDFIVGKFDYFKSDFLIGIIKFIELFSFVMFAFYSGEFIGNVLVSGIIYFLITLQAFIIFDITEVFSKIEAVVFTASPMLIGIIIHLLIDRATNFYILVYVCFICIFIICEIASVKCLSFVYNKLFDKIFYLNNAVSVNKEENDVMKITQEKLVNANQQLSLQRFKLEKANEQITKNNEESQLLNMINKDLAIIKDVDVLVSKICSNIMKYMRTDFCYIGVISSENATDNCFYKFYDFKNKSKIANVNIAFFESALFVKKHSDKSIIMINNNYSNLKMECFKGSEIRSSIMYSTAVGENHNALYIIGNVEENSFVDDTIFVNNLFAQITLAINNAILYFKMHNMAVKDALTNIYNRQYFNSIYHEYLTESYAGENELTVVLFDIDKFKSINDKYGHIVGDEVIRYCGKVSLKYTEENYGFAVRYGGEEFVLVFPNKGLADVLDVCERMHEEIKGHLVVFEDKELHINVSIGIASYPKNCHNPKDLLDSADKAMYYSKRNGRGRITVYNDEINN